MKSLIALVGMVTLASGCISLHPGTPWEYRFMSSNDLLMLADGTSISTDEQIEQALCAMGAEEWELIHVGDHELIFKRPLDKAATR